MDWLCYSLNYNAILYNLQMLFSVDPIHLNDIGKVRSKDIPFTYLMGRLKMYADTAYSIYVYGVISSGCVWNFINIVFCKCRAI